MSAASPLAKEQSFDSVESIITELLDGFARQKDLRDDLTAKGVPLPTIHMLVEMAKSGPESEFTDLKAKSLELAQHKHGSMAVSASELDDSIERLMYLSEEIFFVKKIARGMDLDPQAINMLTQNVLRNPGDRGEKVLSALVEYANACGIRVQGSPLQLVKPEAPKSVLPDIKPKQPKHQGLSSYKDIVIELTIGIAVTLTALSLLT